MNDNTNNAIRVTIYYATVKRVVPPINIALCITW